MANQYEISSGTLVVPTAGDKTVLVRQVLGIWTPYSALYESTLTPTGANSGTSLLSARSDHTHANYVAKVVGGTAGHLAVLANDGSIADGGVVGVAVSSLDVVTDSIGTDLLTINRAGADKTQTVASFIAANTTTIHALNAGAGLTATTEIAASDVPNGGAAAVRYTIAQIAAAVAAINGTSTSGGGGAAPTYATTMTVSAPSTMTVGTASTVTVTGGSGGLDPAKTFTPTAPVAGTFSPTSRAGNGTTPLTFSFTPSAAGSGTFSATATGVTATASGSVTIAAAGGGGGYPTMTLTGSPAFESSAPIWGAKSLKGGAGTGTVTIPLPANANGSGQASVGIKVWFRGAAGTSANGAAPWLTFAAASGADVKLIMVGSSVQASVGGSNFVGPGTSVRDGSRHFLYIRVESNYNVTYSTLYVDGGSSSPTNGGATAMQAGNGTLTLALSNLLSTDVIDNIEVTTDVNYGVTVPTVATVRSSQTIALFDFDAGDGVGS